jgi:hypothetical protein
MEQNEIDRRAHPRYAVSSLDFMKARLDRSSADEKILTLGAGGCGFVAFDRIWLKSEVKRVNSIFELTLPDRVGPISVQGNIVYVKPITLQGRPMYYIGIQFLPEDAHRIRPLIDVLEDLNKRNKINIAVT